MAVTDLRETGRWSGPPAKRWCVVYYDRSQGNKRREKRFSTKKDAQHFDAQWRTRGQRALAVDERTAKTTTLDDFYQHQYIGHVRTHGGKRGTGASDATLTNYTQHWNKWAKPTIGKAVLHDLTRDTITAWRTQVRDDGATPYTVHYVDGMLSRVLDHAVESELLDRNPARTATGKTTIAPKGRKQKPEIYLDGRQVWRLAVCAPDPISRDMILTMASTGLRFGELSALLVGDFDSRTGDITVSKAYSVAAGRLSIGPTKTGETRIVRVAGYPLELLEERARGRRPQEPLFQGARGAVMRRDNWAPRHFRMAVDGASTAIQRLQEQLGVIEYQGQRAWYGPDTENAVLASLTDTIESRPVRFGTLTDHLHGNDLTKAAVTEATADQRRLLLHASVLSFPQYEELYDRFGDGVLAALPQPGDLDFDSRMTPHDLRHTAVSLAIRSGANIKAVQHVAGHATATMTLDQYGHLFEDSRAEVAQLLASELARPTI